MDTYKTAESAGESLFRDKGSKFYGYIFHTPTEEAAKDRLEDIKNLHPKSRHVCYAMQIGYEEPIVRLNDGGEPSGSAGRPIHGRILSHELTNVLGVVVRYFGGTKLGIPGLIHAYKVATDEAIEQGGVEERAIKAFLKIEATYMGVNDLMPIIKTFNAAVVEQVYEAECKMLIALNKVQVTSFIGKFELSSEVKVELSHYA